VLLSDLTQPRYDALTTSNKISYQNSFNSANLPFAQACNGILTNYSWTAEKAIESKTFALKNQFPPENVYFGVDVWAQNTSKLSNPRVTYPEKGGGGTHTGLAVTELAETGLSVGIFAPAWSFEHFDTQRRGVECSMWDGDEFPEDANCTCDGRPHGGRGMSIVPVVRPEAIIRSARSYPAGSESFFYTDFSRAFSPHIPEMDHVYGGKNTHSQLGAQSIIPRSIHRRRRRDSHRSIYGELLSQPSRLAIYHESNELTDTLQLFDLDMPADGVLQLKIIHKNLLATTYPELILDFGSKSSIVPLGRETDEIQTLQFLLRDHLPEVSLENPRLSALSIHIEHCEATCSHGLGIEIFELSILPLDIPQLSCAIVNVRLESRGEDEGTHWRLVWDFNVRQADLESSMRSLGLPYSDVTGLFAYFLICVGGGAVGRAYATEYIIGEGVVDSLKGNAGAEVVVVGVGFDGQRVESGKVDLKL
jgi:hypothetical protein